MANALLGTPATAYIRGQEAGQQARITERQEQRREQQFGEEQKQRKRALEIDDEKLKQLNEKGGFEGAKRILKRDSAILSAVATMPESQQQAAFEAIIPRLEPEALKMFPQDQSGRPLFDPQRAQMIQNFAKEFEGNVGNMYGKTLEAETPDGRSVYLQVSKDGTQVKELKGYKPPTKKGISVTAGPEGTTVQIGGEQRMPLDKVAAREQQGEVIKTEKTLATIQTLKDHFNPDFFTYKGALTQAASHYARKFGISKTEATKRFTGERKKYMNEVGQFFNAYRKEITGAAASIKELELLKDTMINQDLDPDEFQAALQQLEETTMRGRRIAQRLLREGVPVGSKEFGKRHDKLWVSGGDDDPDARGEELSAQGLTDDQVIEKLRQEGYR